MLAPRQIEELFRDLNIPEDGRRYVERVRGSPPSRRVESRVGNVVGRFPSRKMGFVVCTESRHGELALAYQLEHDDAVFEFYAQPEPIKLNYVARSGRETGVMHTPDFLVVARDGIRFVEVKPEDGLQRLAQRVCMKRLT
jgi:putative transposase